MASGSDFIGFDSEMDTSSTEDVGTEWDVDTHTFRDDGAHSREVYYWMGKKYFMCVLAHHIARTTSAPASNIDVDVRNTLTPSGSRLRLTSLRPDCERRYATTRSPTTSGWCKTKLA